MRRPARAALGVREPLVIVERADPEVAQHDSQLIAVKEHILRLNVPMDDAVRVPTSSASATVRTFEIVYSDSPASPLAALSRLVA